MLAFLRADRSRGRHRIGDCFRERQPAMEIANGVARPTAPCSQANSDLPLRRRLVADSPVGGAMGQRTAIAEPLALAEVSVHIRGLEQANQAGPRTSRFYSA